jgi:hypothetical protein
MKNRISCLVGAALIAVGCGSALYAQDVSSGVDRSSVPQRQVRGGIFTLYALDPLARALCLRDGREGLAFQKNRWANRCSDLSFSLAGDGTFVTGIEANRVAAIIDLGTAREVRERYGFEDAENGGEGFASLRLDGDKIVILKEDNPNETLQPLKEGSALFAELGPSANVPIRLGHIYLLRIADKKDKSYQQVAKFIVIAYSPNESVTLRWEPL